MLRNFKKNPDFPANWGESGFNALSLVKIFDKSCVREISDFKIEIIDPNGVPTNISIEKIVPAKKIYDKTLTELTLSRSTKINEEVSFDTIRHWTNWANIFTRYNIFALLEQRVQPVVVIRSTIVLDDGMRPKDLFGTISVHYKEYAERWNSSGLWRYCELGIIR